MNKLNSTLQTSFVNKDKLLRLQMNGVCVRCFQGHMLMIRCEILDHLTYRRSDCELDLGGKTLNSFSKVLSD